MQTPAGKECRHYYQDFHRGRNIQECRLVKENPESLRWKPVDCSLCPVPEILNANASKDMQLTLTVRTRLLGLGRKLTVAAHCLRHNIPIEDPYIGCPKDREERGAALDIFRKALENDTNPE
ncbi:MAG: hypothetical protein ACOYL5_11030 [Phototrophicaceae bacterium]|jgi:hypothetical protein